MVSEPDESGRYDEGALAGLSVAKLLELSRAILAELKRRGVIRSGNAPAGDYGELLVQRATGGELAPSSQKSWDVETPSGEHLQVKARVVTNPKAAGERQLSVFRSWDFDAGVIVLFDDQFRVWRAAHLPVALLEQAARSVEHVRGFRVMATDALLDRGDDWTELLRAATADRLRYGADRELWCSLILLCGGCPPHPLWRRSLVKPGLPHRWTPAGFAVAVPVSRQAAERYGVRPDRLADRRRC